MPYEDEPPPLPSEISKRSTDGDGLPPDLPERTRTTHDKEAVKQGAAIGGWICFGLGAAVMYWSVWSFMLYIPLFFVGFVLSIVAMAQRRILAGILLLLATLIVSPVEWLVLSATRTNKVLDDAVKYTQDHPIGGNASPAQQGAKAPAAPSTPEGNKAVDVILKEPLNDAHAWQMQIAHTAIIASNVPGVAPLFSRDGESVMFLQKGEGSRFVVVTASLRDNHVISTWTPAQTPQRMVWSPDGKRLAYLAWLPESAEPFASYHAELHMVDWATKSDVVVPRTDRFYGDRLAWVGSNKLATYRIWERFGDGGCLLDLDTLEMKSDLNNDASFKQLVDDSLRTQRDHPHCRIYREEPSGQEPLAGGGGGSAVLVREQDGSYARSILTGVAMESWLYVSPDLRHLLIQTKDGTLTHYVLGLREVPEMRFRVDLSDLQGSRRSSLQEYIQRGVPFRGPVYVSQTNPLNGKAIGPDTKHLKGFVRVSEWHAGYAVVVISKEWLPIKAGDALASIESDETDGWPPMAKGRYKFQYTEQGWQPLQPAPPPGQAAPSDEPVPPDKPLPPSAPVLPKPSPESKATPAAAPAFSAPTPEPPATSTAVPVPPAPTPEPTAMAAPKPTAPPAKDPLLAAAEQARAKAVKGKQVADDAAKSKSLDPGKTRYYKMAEDLMASAAESVQAGDYPEGSRIYDIAAVRYDDAANDFIHREDPVTAAPTANSTKPAAPDNSAKKAAYQARTSALQVRKSLQGLQPLTPAAVQGKKNFDDGDKDYNSGKFDSAKKNYDKATDNFGLAGKVPPNRRK